MHKRSGKKTKKTISKQKIQKGNLKILNKDLYYLDFRYEKIYINYIEFKIKEDNFIETSIFIEGVGKSDQRYINSAYNINTQKKL